MVSDGMGPGGGNSFTWGVTSTPNGAARLFTKLGTIDASSNATADGTITLVLPKSIIQNPGPGDSIAITLASVRLGTPSGGTNETIPDSTGAGSYTLRPDNQCLPNTAPLAALTANVSQGAAPLVVTFDGSASSDPDVIDHIASYTFNFNDGGNDVTQTSPTIMHTFTDSGEYIVRLVVTDSRGKVSSNTATFIVEVGPPLTAVVSRKVHGAGGGTFDINLPLTGTPGIECRSGGATNDYKLVFSFANNLTSVTSASVTGGTGSVSSSVIGPNPNQYTVNLTGVTNAQYVTVALAGVHDASGGNFGVAQQMAVLVGDVNGSGRVDGSDVSLIRQQNFQPLTQNPPTFREDVNVSGRIDGTDVSIARQQNFTVLPP